LRPQLGEELAREGTASLSSRLEVVGKCDGGLRAHGSGIQDKPTRTVEIWRIPRRTVQPQLRVETLEIRFKEAEMWRSNKEKYTYISKQKLPLRKIIGTSLQ
jgi:hypothetical protein